MVVTFDNIKPKQNASTKIVSGTGDTAHDAGSGKTKVLAPPVMMMLLEESVQNAVEVLLPNCYQYVGKIACCKLFFKVWADDERIGEGNLDRVVAGLTRFDDLVKQNNSYMIR